MSLMKSTFYKQPGQQPAYNKAPYWPTSGCRARLLTQTEICANVYTDLFF